MKICQYLFEIFRIVHMITGINNTIQNNPSRRPKVGTSPMMYIYKRDLGKKDNSNIRDVFTTYLQLNVFLPAEKC